MANTKTKYNKPIIGRFESVNGMIVDVMCIRSSTGFGEGRVVYDPNDDYPPGVFLNNWVAFDDPHWQQIPIEKKQEMNKVDEEIKLLKERLASLEAAREAEKKYATAQAKKKIDWSKVPVDTPVRVSMDGAVYMRCFSHVDGDKYLCFDDGASSVTEIGAITGWNCAKIAFDKCEWKPWFGGECPVPGSVLVEVILRNGDKTMCGGSAALLRWNHIKNDGDIIAYRMVGLADGWEF